ncbi:MAG: hypothetical protein IT204_07755 [Fimbriimonadaceae bacterium]|nr:hypothetical protein [Fimbriimonadaceae bacterium]
MKRALLLGLGLWVQAVMAVPQPQVIDNFAGGWNGRPAGWELVGFGAEGTLRQVAEAPGFLALSYRFSEPGGVLYLLRRARLREVPWGLEVTVRSQGAKGELLGSLVREAASGRVHEFRADPPLRETGWATRAIEPKLPADGGKKEWETLEGGGGLRFEGFTLRQGPGGAAEGTVEFDEVNAQCDVEPNQEAMVDILPARLDGLFTTAETPQVELAVCAVNGQRTRLDVNWTVTDGSGGTVGSGQQQVDGVTGTLTRVPVTFTPAAGGGFYTVKATARTARSERHATARVAQVPEVPTTPGRFLAVDVEPSGAAEAWFDVLTLRALQRAGAGWARYLLKWSSVDPTQGRGNWAAFEQLVRVSRAVGLPLWVRVSDPPGWALRGDASAALSGYRQFVAEAQRRAAGQVAIWEIWREPNNGRYWPPDPQPFGFRSLLGEVTRGFGEPAPVVINGGLRGFDAGFAGALLFPPAVVPQIAYGVPQSRHAFPFVPGEKRPSELADKLLSDHRAWLAGSGRSYTPAWLTDVGVRTSPVEESKTGQAVELARCAILAKAYGGQMAWHAALDGDDPLARFGLLRRTLEPKPALAAFAAVAAALHGAKYLGSPAGNPKAWVFTGPAGFVAAGWQGLYNPGGAKARGVYGQEGEGGQPSGAPLYLSGAAVAKLLQ